MIPVIVCLHVRVRERETERERYGNGRDTRIGGHSSAKGAHVDINNAVIAKVSNRVHETSERRGAEI